jgi:hypothetical protein
MHGLPAPSISHRLSLRFESDGLPTNSDHLERTSTLVLNGGGTSALFTDFRPLRAAPAECEWAFAGVKTILPDGRTCWTHDVDSRRAHTVPGGEEEAPDVGACETLPNGDEIERGEMVNPATGRIERYEELWRADSLPAGSRVRVLVRRDLAAARVRGVFIRVASWAQLVTEDDAGRVGARRWRLPEDGQWLLESTYGPVLDAPSPAADGHDGWDIVEDYIWRG